MTEETLDQISDADVFKEAVADAPKVEAEAPEKEQTEEAKTEDRTRDEKGRFVAKDKDEDVGDEPAPVAEAALEEAQPEEAPKEEKKQDNRIPLTELLNEREKRQNAERQREAVQQQLWQLQQQLQAQQQPAEPIDIFANPEAYTAQVQQTMEQRLKAMEGNFSLRLAHYKHGELFGEAWQEMTSRTQSGDDSMRQQVLASNDPGETLVTLYQREKVVKEVGPDPIAYKSKILEEALKDPQFLAKAMQTARQTAGAQPTNNKIDLPPSLNKVASAHSGDDGDDSDSSVFNYAIGRR
jgi:hypothetical protein